VALRAHGHRMEFVLARFRFSICKEQDRVVPCFEPDEAGMSVLDSTQKIHMTILGPESSSLFHIHQIVEYMEYMLIPKEDMEWEFVASRRSSSEEFVAILQNV
jgi:hypothetical protein